MNTQVTKVGEVVKTKTFSKLEVSKVYTSDFQKEGTQSAELRQIVTTVSKYPSKRVSNNLQDNIFGTESFGFPIDEYQNESTRVAFIDVPLDVTLEDVEKQLAKFEKAMIYQIISNHPILSDSQEYAIKEGLITLDKIANSQAMRYPASSPSAGQVILDDLARPIYRGTFFSTTKVTDIDRRSSVESDFYISPELKAEIVNTSVAQDPMF